MDDLVSSQFSFIWIPFCLFLFPAACMSLLSSSQDRLCTFQTLVRRILYIQTFNSLLAWISCDGLLVEDQQISANSKSFSKLSSVTPSYRW